MIELDDIQIRFGGSEIITGLSLAIRQGEFFTLLGPSGCGKTTLLRTIAGFVVPVSGTVIIDGQDVTALPPEDRRVGVVFQNYALFPHLSVFDNVAFGLRVGGETRRSTATRVHEMLERTGVAEHAKKKPAELSGGQQQRVAIARALILGTRVILLDEPLSNLDAKLRETMRDEIRDLQRQLGLTAVYVTHDQGEALALSDRIAVMKDGLVRQIGAPHDLYQRPTDPFVCTFVGETSRLPARIGLGQAIFARPEDVHLGRREGDGWITLAPILERLVYHGARMRLVLRDGPDRLLADVPAGARLPTQGTPVPVSIRRDAIHVFAEEPE